MATCDPVGTGSGRAAVVQLPAEALHALAAGDLEAASRRCGLALPAVFVAPDWIGTWRMRSAQVAEDPAAVAWVTGAVVDLGTGEVVGKAGFHGPPQDGRLEVGYAVRPDRRRRGHARAALVSLLERAAGEPAVHTVRASVSPDNLASLALVREAGFAVVGEQWDPEDGLELVLERPAR